MIILFLEKLIFIMEQL